MVCSTTILPRYRLLTEPSYPGIASDFDHTYTRLRSLPCDVFPAPHAGFFDMQGKRKRLEEGAPGNPFVDPEGYREYVRRGEADFRRRLEEERKRPLSVA